jgi:hypothetical protein
MLDLSFRLFTPKQWLRVENINAGAVSVVVIFQFFYES